MSGHEMADQTGFCIPYKVKETPGKGRGVFAEAAARKGDVLWRFVAGRYSVYDEQTFLAVIEGMSVADIIYELTHAFGVRDFPGFLIRIHDDGVLINHARDANTASQSVIAGAPPPTASTLSIPSVTKALLDDRYALVALRDIVEGEELTNNYEIEAIDPPFYQALCERYGVDDDYLDAD